MKISSQELMSQASRITGLKDFGDPSFRLGLDRLVESINQDSTPIDTEGLAISSSIVELLVNRLKVEDWYGRHPEIDDEVIQDPVFITGLPRTGSTALGHMLALDNETRCLRGWEAYEPCPPPDINIINDARIEACRKRMAEVETAVPGIAEALPRNVNAPEECYILLNLSFACVAFNGLYHVPRYEQWAMRENLAEIDAAYRYHRRVLKLLQWRTPANRWVLRTPVHSLAMGSLLKVYPDARFIITHRHPLKVLTSICSLIYQGRERYIVNPSPLVLGASQTSQWAEAMRRLLRDRADVGEERFFDIYHREQIADPEPDLRRLYDWLDWGRLTDEFILKIGGWRKENPKGRHGPDPGFFGLDADDIDSQFRLYIDRFGVRM